MIFDTLKEIGIILNSEKTELLNKFIELFKSYNEKVNLVSKNDINLLYEKHIYDSLAFRLFEKKYPINHSIKLLDIGTGGGFPAIPIAIINKNIQVYALDSTAKKIKFIENVKAELNLDNLHPICARAEDLNENYKKSFDIITSRAMAELRIILEYSMPYLKKDGYFIAYKSLKAEEEIHISQNSLKILKGKIIDKIEYSLPLKEENKRVLLIIQKTGNAPDIYPRKNGLIMKKPL